MPKITLIVGHSFGAGHYALCGKAFDPRFLFAWPAARYAVMGAQQAARTMLDVNVAALKRQGKQVDDAELARDGRGASRAATIARPTSATPPPRLWVDAIIDPAQTREVLIVALDVAARHREADADHDGRVSGLTGVSRTRRPGRSAMSMSQTTACRSESAMAPASGATTSTPPTCSRATAGSTS